jgi:hypothetical protein
MSIRRVFQVITFVVALAFSFAATGVSNTAYACDPNPSSPGFCG